MLLRGRRIFFIGGDDAHGDFNLFRQIRLPLVRMIDSSCKVFGKVRTCLYCREGPDEASLLQALRQGQIVVTSGPFVTGIVENEAGQTALIGQTISGKKMKVRITARSTEEFGNLKQVILYRGHLKEKKEERREFILGTDFSDPKEVELTDTFKTDEHPAYLRLEAVSQKEGVSLYAYTNPIWIEPG